MKTGQKGIELIKSFEGCQLKAYLCSAGIPTIGWGNTFYEDGRKVKIGDSINQEMADDLLRNLLPKFEAIVNKNISVVLNQNEFDALVSHTYNTGGSKTLFHLINNKASNIDIRNWFEKKYTTAKKNGVSVELPGLVRRRKAEANLYFS